MDEQQQSPAPELTAEQEAAFSLSVLKATAVRQAMVEVLAEQRDAIVHRARAKLTAMGVTLSDEEAGSL